MEIVLVYTTVASKKDAECLAEKMLSKKLAACANMHEIDSMYWWKDRLEKGPEYAVSFKTSQENSERLLSELKKDHPYEVPCILCYTADAEKEYFDYVMDSTK